MTRGRHVPPLFQRPDGSSGTRLTDIRAPRLIKEQAANRRAVPG
ncbi:MAG: hypothetical protein RMM58_04540 [Chloroflexota bacterium]|nr:hypothetical protein [Dehalococcoidia bacterium]MDW8253130.1 hypothetical protein [Chloroflexota bacterium]